jgi:excisionase family DNA binding protein
MGLIVFAINSSGSVLMSQESCGLGDHETPRVGRRTYTVEEAAAMLGLSRNAAYRACRAGTFPGLIKIGRRFLVSKVAFDAAVPKDAA